jgi:hypothetical protein
VNTFQYWRPHLLQGHQPASGWSRSRRCARHYAWL